MVTSLLRKYFKAFEIATVCSISIHLWYHFLNKTRLFSHIVRKKGWNSKRICGEFSVKDGTGEALSGIFKGNGS